MFGLLSVAKEVAGFCGRFQHRRYPPSTPNTKKQRTPTHPAASVQHDWRPPARQSFQVLSQSEQGKEAAGQVVDARSLARFKAEIPEPRPGVSGGHVPGSVCVPFSKVVVDGDVNRLGFLFHSCLLSQRLS